MLVGPSGCGKSTTLRMVAGLEEISEGELYIDGRLCNNVEPKALSGGQRQRVAIGRAMVRDPMVSPTVDLKVDVSTGAKVNFTTQPRLIQLFDKATGNNLIWYDEKSAAADAPVCKKYNF